MDDFCGSEFWLIAVSGGAVTQDAQLTWYTSDPRFTPCFEKTVISWIPIAFLWIGVALDISCSNMKLSKTRIAWTHLTRAKAILAILLSFVEVSRFSVAVKNNYYPVDTCNAVIKVSSLLLYLYWVLNSRRGGVPSPGVQFGFWLLLVTCDAIILRSAFMNETKDDENAEDSGNISLPTIFQSISFGFVVVQFIISCFLDISPNDKKKTVLAGETTLEESASFLSKTLLTWLDPFIWKGFRKPLTPANLSNLNEGDKSSTVTAKFDRLWNWQCGKPNSSEFIIDNRSSTPIEEFFPYDGAHVGFSKRNLDITEPREYQSLIPCLVQMFGGSFFKGALLRFTKDCMTLISPIILYCLISFLKEDEEAWKGYFYAISLFVVAVVQTIFQAQDYVKMYRTSLHVRAALVGAIYRKTLLISNHGKTGSTVGEIVNYMDVDVEKVTDFVPLAHVLCCGPIQISIVLYMLWTILGHSVWAGILVMVIFNSINLWMTSSIETNQNAIMKFKDLRVKLVNQILIGIKLIKLYGWELSLSNEILKLRDQELKVVKTNLNIYCANNFFWKCTPFCMSLAAFAIYIMVDDAHVLDAQTAFVSLALFDMIRTPLEDLPTAIGMGLQALVSIKRISNFMNIPDIDYKAVTHYSNEHDSVTIDSGCFTWSPQAEPILKNININIRKGSLVAVVGVIGSGKSTLLSAILGEIEKLSGLVNTTGKIAYVSQQAWIQNGTLRDNILYGKTWNSSIYEKVLVDCALQSDLATLPAGDATEIGEKGINVSGGQKQRVSLARAVYNEADIYLLDDPLSAVDCHVSRHIFDNVIGPNGTLRKTTRVLVTHGIAFLPQVDSIIVIKDGRISEVGNYQELLQKDQGAFGEFLKEHMVEELEDDRPSSQKMTKLIYEDCGINVKEYDRSNSLSISSKSVAVVSGGRITSVEMCEENEVKFGVYLDYFQAWGWSIFISSLFVFLLFQASVVASRFWLSQWTNHAQSSFNVTAKEYSANQINYLAVYGCFGLGQAMFILAALYIQSFGALKSASFLHLKMLTRIMRAPLWFFETTPVGRILNRFSKDVDATDTKLPRCVRLQLMHLFEVLGTFVIICYTFPIFMIAIIPIAALYYFTQHLYVSTSRQLKRLDAISRSPMYSHFGETIGGASTIRAYGMQSHFITGFERKTDANLKACFPSVLSNGWVEMRLDMIGHTIVLLAALFAVIGKERVDEGLSALALSSALMMVRTLGRLAFYTAEFEASVVSVERLKEYGECVQEASWAIEKTKPLPNWPDHGVIEFDNYHTRYREGLPLCLNGITCRIEKGEKIGIVGRTGAGKSSFAVSLFRIIEPTAGTIKIDGVDITGIGLHDLRRRITIIPQDPVLFSGKVRLNLDPESALPDEKLWRALELAHLKEFILTLPDGLDHEMEEEGKNFSVGQRQLLCLARALLKKTKVLILDEATAAVDLDTDDLIQQTIRTEFSDTTVLTIAHRINTIMDSSRVLVLDKGEICELDTPSNLLQLKSSVFYSLAKEAGLV